MIKILLNGSKGRMGQAILAVAPNHDAIISSAIDEGDDLSKAIVECDVVIDFSFHSVTLPVVELAAKHKKPVVIGTTGHSAEDKEKILSFTKAIPIVWAGNYSTGVNLLFYLTQKAAEVLNADFDMEIIEMHHHHKKDAPSGTAARLLEVLQDVSGIKDDQVAHGRKGIIGERPKNEIGMHCLRGGDVVGEHTVMFSGIGEKVELTHKATDRKIFANGSVKAAHWVLTQDAGLYSMQDVLGLK